MMVENTRGKVEYVLFDMDGQSLSISAYIQSSDTLSQGLMIDSERIYTMATSQLIFIIQKLSRKIQHIGLRQMLL